MPQSSAGAGPTPFRARSTHCPSLAVRLLAALVLLLYPVAAGALLLTSDGWAVNRLNARLWYAVTGAVGLREQITPEMFAALANVALFVPFFAALAVLVPTWWWVLGGAALSGAVELYQGGIGREQDVVDILANTAGAALGVWLGLLVRRIALRRAARSGAAARRGAAKTLRSEVSDASSAPTAPTTLGERPAETGHGPGGGPDDRG